MSAPDGALQELPPQLTRMLAAAATGTAAAAASSPTAASAGSDSGYVNGAAYGNGAASGNGGTNGNGGSSGYSSDWPADSGASSQGSPMFDYPDSRSQQSQSRVSRSGSMQAHCLPAAPRGGRAAAPLGNAGNSGGFGPARSAAAVLRHRQHAFLARPMSSGRAVAHAALRSASGSRVISYGGRLL